MPKIYILYKLVKKNPNKWSGNLCISSSKMHLLVFQDSSEFFQFLKNKFKMLKIVRNVMIFRCFLISMFLISMFFNF